MSFRHSVPLDVNAKFRSANSSSGHSLLCSSVVTAATAAAVAAGGGGGGGIAALMLIWLQSAALSRLSQKRIIISSCTRNPSFFKDLDVIVTFVLRKWFMVLR